MKFRHELKYLIKYQDYIVIKMRLSGVFKRDQNVSQEGSYTVRSLYFDDYFNTAYNEKYSGLINRQKYRIRIYNHSDSIINLERKIKSNRYIHKQTTPLTNSEARSIVDGDYKCLLESANNLYKIFYHELVTNLYRPRVVVDYEREPFIMDEGDVRITFDKNIRAGTLGYELFDPYMPTIEVLDPGLLIMEIKYSEFFPKVLRKLLPSKSTNFTAVSKYILGCDKIKFKAKSFA